MDRSGSVMRSLQCNRLGSVRAQRLAHTCVRVWEKRASLGPRPPTVTGNSLKFSSPSLLPRFFPSWTAQRMSCGCVSGPPRTKSPFSVMIFVIEVGSHHIYDDTRFCHNYHHRSVICMTEFFFVRPKMSRMCLFSVVMGEVLLLVVMWIWYSFDILMRCMLSLL